MVSSPCVRGCRATSRKRAGISTVNVKPFDDDEALKLARAKPALRPLLFGEDQVIEIARRPFFAAVLAGATADPDGGALTPRSETELMDAWWARGGCLAGPSKITHRQHALRRLAKAGAANLGRRIGLDDFDIDVIEGLERDAILRGTSGGHSVQFVHDIFFEWSFTQLLLSRKKLGWRRSAPRESRLRWAGRWNCSHRKCSRVTTGSTT